MRKKHCREHTSTWQVSGKERRGVEEDWRRGEQKALQGEEEDGKAQRLRLCPHHDSSTWGGCSKREGHIAGPEALNVDRRQSAGRSLCNSSLQTWYHVSWWWLWPQPSQIPHAAPSSFKLSPGQHSLNPLRSLISTCSLCFLPSRESRRLPLTLVKIQKTPITHVAVSAIAGAAENAESAPAGSHGAAAGAKPGQALRSSPLPNASQSTRTTRYTWAAIYMVANKQRGLADAFYSQKRGVFLPHTPNGCSSGPLAKPAACTCPCRRRLGNQHGTQQCSSPATERARPVQTMYLCK